MKNSEHLQFIHNRMVEVHGENENLDYLIKLREIISTIKTQEENVEISNRPKKTIFVISVDTQDFINWKKSGSLSYIPLQVPRRFVDGNDTYRCITDVCDLCSWSADDIIETEHAIENPDYYHIIESSRLCLKENKLC